MYDPPEPSTVGFTGTGCSMGAGAAGGGAWYTGAGAAADMYTGPGAGDGARAGPGEEDTGREAAPPWGCRDGGREDGTGSPRLLMPTCQM